LDDFKSNSNGHSFNVYYRLKGKNYFYELLKSLADLSSLQQDDFIDWGSENKYSTAIGVGECAGVMIDLVATLVYEAEEKLEWAEKAKRAEAFADAVYHAYSAFVSGAKALLLSKEVQCNTHQKILSDFQEHFVITGEYLHHDDGLRESFNFVSFVNRIQQNEPTAAFAHQYIYDANSFIQNISQLRTLKVVK
jgi:sulfite reductase (ferredoxin)